MTFKDDVRKFMGAKVRDKAPVSLKEMENYGREEKSSDGQGQNSLQHINGIQSVDGKDEKPQSGIIKGDVSGNNKS